MYKALVPLRTRVWLRWRVLGILRPLAYKGNNVTCNICQKTWKCFAPFGVIQRPNVLCPSCESAERQRFIWYYLNHHTNYWDTPQRVLHFAPELCFETRFRNNKYWQYTSADLLKGMAERVEQIENLTFPDEHFDLLFCSHVLGYVHNEAKALSEIHRVLKINGVAIILTRIHYATPRSFYGGELKTSKRESEYGLDPYVVRVHGMDYANILAQQGNFDVTPIRWSDCCDEPTARHYGFISSEADAGICDGETLFICKKRTT